MVFWETASSLSILLQVCYSHLFLSSQCCRMVEVLQKVCSHLSGLATVTINYTMHRKMTFKEMSMIKTSFDHSNVFWRCVLFKAISLLLSSPMLLDPHPSQLHEGIHHAVGWLQQEVTRPKARFKPTLTEKSGVNGRAIRC